MTKYLILFIAVAFAAPASATALNPTSIAPAVAEFAALLNKPYIPAKTAAVAALSSFKGAINPLSAAITVGAGLYMLHIADNQGKKFDFLPGSSSAVDPDGATSTIGQLQAVPAGATYLTQFGLFGETFASWMSVTPDRGCPSTTQWNCFYTEENGYVKIYGTPKSGGSPCSDGAPMVSGACLIPSHASDGVETVKNNGGQWERQANDPDLSSDPIPSSRTGTDEHGNPVSEEVTPNPDGSVRYRRKEQSENPSTGEPVTNVTTIDMSSTGVITSVSTQTFNSTIANTSVTNQTQEVDVSKLNKETTQQEIKDLLNPDTAPDLSTFGDPETQKFNDAVSDVQSSSTDLSNNPAAQLNIPEYWTFASGTCYPATFDAGRFGTLSFSSFCQIYDDHIRGLIVFMLAVWSVLHIFGYWSEVVREI